MNESKLSTNQELALNDFLNTLQSQLVDFDTSLQNESAAIQKRDLTSLSQNLESKQTCLDAINQTTQLIEQHIQPLTLENLLTQSSELCNQSNTINQIHEVNLLTQKCHDLNMSNGISIQILSHHNNEMLSILKGGSTKSVKLYGSKGSTQATTSTQTTLGKA